MMHLIHFALNQVGDFFKEDILGHTHHPSSQACFFAQSFING